jgi:hypothetical protein
MTRGLGATFLTHVEFSPTSATGTGWERTPWHATQRAAWEALRRQQANVARADCGEETRRVMQSLLAARE